MTVGAAVDRAAQRLDQAGVESPQVDAEWLAAKALGLSRSELVLEEHRELTDSEQTELAGLVERRSRREPLAYILGEWGFRRLMLKVDPRVLVPRPETEVVVGRCLELLDGLDTPDVLDVGTGSGAIALAIADEHPGARVTGIDVSAEALALARENAASTGIAVRLEQRDLLQGLSGEYDLVVSNPPYVGVDEIELVQPEVREWEPRLATVGEEHTAAIARSAREALRPGGWLVLEVGDGRAEQVAALLRDLGYEAVRASPDLAGRDRVVEGRWGSSSRR